MPRVDSCGEYSLGMDAQYPVPRKVVQTALNTLGVTVRIVYYWGYVLPGGHPIRQTLPYNEIEANCNSWRSQSWLDVLFEVMAWAGTNAVVCNGISLRRALQALLGMMRLYKPCGRHWMLCRKPCTKRILITRCGGVEVR